MKKMTEGERTAPSNDIKILPALIQCTTNKDKRIVDISMKLIMIICENNPKFVLPEFNAKGNGITTCIDIYTNNNDPNLTLYTSQILVLYFISNRVEEINKLGRIDFLNTILRNFSSQDEKIRVNAVKIMSLLLRDRLIHDLVYNISDFQFLIHDANEMIGLPQLYKEEQDILLYLINIFCEFSKTPNIAQNFTTNGIITLAFAVMMDENKYKKELRLSAVILIDRSCSLVSGPVADYVILLCLSIKAPSFLSFILSVSYPEDKELSIHTKNIWNKFDELGK
jgi:hypothetical protein